MYAANNQIAFNWQIHMYIANANEHGMQINEWISSMWFYYQITINEFSRVLITFWRTHGRREFYAHLPLLPIENTPFVEANFNLWHTNLVVVSTYGFQYIWVSCSIFDFNFDANVNLFIFWTRLWMLCVHYVQYLLKISCIHGWIIRISFELRFIPCETGLFAQWSIYMLIYCHWLVSAAATSQLHNFQLEHTYRKINSI